MHSLDRACAIVWPIEALRGAVRNVRRQATSCPLVGAKTMRISTFAARFAQERTHQHGFWHLGRSRRRPYGRRPHSHAWVEDPEFWSKQYTPYWWLDPWQRALD